MKVVILAGGFGTRLSEETHLIPKPMIEIGGRPMLWHIMKIYSHYGFNDFVILLGYKGYLIKQYFQDYFLHQSDVTFDLKQNKMEIHSSVSEPWRVTLLDTGLQSQTGGRLLRAKNHLNDGPFLFTYGDGVSDVNLTELISFHRKMKKKVTVTAVQPEGRFGSLNIENHLVTRFNEKPKGDGSWINGGFFVCEQDIFNYLRTDETIFEKEPLESLALEGELSSFKHQGFWKPMDTLRDKTVLEEMWKNSQAPWKKWDD